MTALQAQYQTTTPAFKLTATPTSGYALSDTDPSQYGARPLACYLQATTQNIRFTTDGVTTPTSSVGTLLVAGAAPFYYFGELNKLQFIQVTSGAVLNVIYATVFDGPQGPPGSVDSVVAGTNVTVDNTDPANPIVSATGGVTLPITLAPNDVLADDGSNALIGTDANGNPYLQMYDGGGNAISRLGATVNGDLSVPYRSGPEQITASADRDFSSDTGNWTGTGWTIAAGKATHVAGANNFVLSNSALTAPPVAGQFYEITFTITTTTPSTTGIYAGIGSTYVSYYLGTSAGTKTYTQRFSATGTGEFTFFPDDTWEGSVDDVSVKTAFMDTFFIGGQFVLGNNIPPAGYDAGNESFPYQPQITLTGQGGSNGNLRFVGSGNGGFMDWFTSGWGGSPADPVPMAQNDYIASWDFYAWDGTLYEYGLQQVVSCNGDPNMDGSVPAYLTWAWSGASLLSASVVLDEKNGKTSATFGQGADFIRLMQDAANGFQARNLADNAFAALQGKLKTDTNATTGLTPGDLAASTNASLVIYDANGAAYKIPAIAV